ncbi:SpoIID/LytB domain-containing protein [Nocardioides sp. ChNu-153]|uniref:SpoIID/LytB domain-containing protein n=1 Tax=unclassified Nocardioides TaxID=2615069 RepID=UPI002406AC60|nr:MULTISPECIES: SpoIID/LytB domain-containing protein [unclassified Nocardioides]MDF9718017.1 SpoIID/LytB domain-containing protein [Nocardioides sp. ChNu-99]MDN7121315.1 SpoIID/LytB domain-containing protein [Nocardioides sp. ChNu-153]
MPVRPRRPRLRRARLLASLLLGVGLVAAGGGRAGAVPVDDQWWAVPNAATIAIDGHGFGHGNGMSQYGAYGAAQRGVNVREILRFYYPGTTVTTAGGTISVRISADDDGDTIVGWREGLTVVDRGTNARLPVPAGVSGSWRVSYGGSDTSIVSFARGGKWVFWKRTQGEAELYASGGAIPLILDGGRSTVQYRGTLRAAISEPGASRRDTVNHVTLEHYLRGVVPREMPSSWTPAAVQAQAVAARTYAVQQRSEPKARHYQICDTTTCQVYGGYTAEKSGSNRAIDATAGAILSYQGEPAFAQFSSSNGGWTNNGSAPYLTARQDPYDSTSANPNHTWLLRVTDVTIERAWPQLGNLQAIAVSDRNGYGEWGGRVNSVTFRGSAGTVTVTGATVRSKLGLKSTWFTFRVAPRS